MDAVSGCTEHLTIRSDEGSNEHRKRDISTERERERERERKESKRECLTLTSGVPSAPCCARQDLHGVGGCPA